ncbi:hypothetical protein DL95DRAFT_118890 [Leptodontidium sp. 2 PMI_412]|nr:hypothetical protein DL95DRAFT_118890 [Leptodontidium sp. 2 PMI_412]
MGRPISNFLSHKQSISQYLSLFPSGSRKVRHELLRPPTAHLRHQQTGPNQTRPPTPQERHDSTVERTTPSRLPSSRIDNIRHELLPSPNCAPSKPTTGPNQTRLPTPQERHDSQLRIPHSIPVRRELLHNHLRTLELQTGTNLTRLPPPSHHIRPP